MEMKYELISYLQPAEMNINNIHPSKQLCQHTEMNGVKNTVQTVMTAQHQHHHVAVWMTQHHSQHYQHILSSRRLHLIVLSKNRIPRGSTFRYFEDRVPLVMNDVSHEVWIDFILLVHSKSSMISYLLGIEADVWNDVVLLFEEQSANSFHFKAVGEVWIAFILLVP